MNRDDIARMAQEAGIMPPGWGATESQWRSLHAFADLVAAAERQACAEACNKYIQNEGDGQALGWFVGVAGCIEAIRTRGQQ